MKISCGPSLWEKYLAKQEWHRWYAWRPVRVAPGDCRWLEEVSRKGKHYAGMGADWWEWEYRIPGVATGAGNE